jgi:hypothetical protein
MTSVAPSLTLRFTTTLKCPSPIFVTFTLETVAVIGTAFLIKTGIDWSEEIIAKGVAWLDSPNNIITPLAKVILDPVLGVNLGATNLEGLQIAIERIKLLALGHYAQGRTPELPKPEATATDKIRAISTSGTTELLEWIISFVAAYLIVHNFGYIVQAGKDILGVAKSLLGIAAVA